MLIMKLVYPASIIILNILAPVSGFEFSFTCGVSSKLLDERIFGGTEVEIGEIPWQALLRIKFSGNPELSSCGGMLLSNRIVLTAAHCLERVIQTDYVQVILGTHDINQLSINQLVFTSTQWAIHPGYGKKLEVKDFDAGVVILPDPIPWSRYPNIRPICLPAGGDVSVALGKPAIVSGWGLTNEAESTGVLRKASVMILPNKRCSDSQVYGKSFTNEMICAASEDNADACQGDSGGPLVSDQRTGRHFEVIGIVSWAKGCGLPGFPGVYTSIASVFTWLRDCLEMKPEDIPTFNFNINTPTNADQDPPRNTPVPVTPGSTPEPIPVTHAPTLDQEHGRANNSIAWPGGAKRRPSQQENAGEVTLVAGGFVGHVGLISKVDTYGSCNVNVDPLPVRICKHAAATLAEEVVVCGGRQSQDNGPVLVSPKCFVIGKKLRWREGFDMTEERMGFTLTTVGDQLVATGGRDSSNNYLDSIEVLSATSGWRKKSAKLSSPRWDHCTVQLSETEIGVMGGSDNSRLGRLDTVERIDIQTGEISWLRSLPEPTSTLACQRILGSIYIAGGGTRSGAISTVYSLDFSASDNSWRAHPPLHSPRYGHTSTVLNGKFTLFGGLDNGDRTIDSYETYRDGVWIVSPMSGALYSAAGVLPCI